ncbi:MAG: hypothetical protein HOW73_35055 [Polyangiaceae bacterium]|nr:hypothetical protein [Polyangiaceae bacterium]
MNDSDLEKRIDALYAGPLDEFIAARKALATDLKAAAKKDAAARVLGLPKPNAVAAAVNRYHFEHPKKLGQLLSAGRDVRAAFRATLAASAGAGAASALARAKKAQRDEVNAAVEQITRDLEEVGKPLSAANLDKLGVTLEAISTTGKFGDGPAGRLVRELEPPGLDVLTMLGDDGDTVAETAPPSEPAPASERRKLAAHADDAKSRARELSKATSDLDDVTSDIEKLERRLARLDEENEELQGEETKAVDELDAIRNELRESRARREELRRELEEVETRVGRLDRRVDEHDKKVQRTRDKRASLRTDQKEARARASELESKRKELTVLVKRLGGR